MQQMVKMLSVILFIAFLGCSPGLYTRMGSSTPRFGPIYIGMTRVEAERYLGPPVMTTRISKKSYECIYEYEVERDVIDTITSDIMDFTTFGMGILIISPIDRFKGNRHIMAIIYEMEDEYIMNDRTMIINEQLKTVQ